MEEFVNYLFKSVVWLTGFALVYLLFLRNERYFLLNRIYLIAGIVASVLFPFFTWHYTIVIPFTPSVEVSDLQLISSSQNFTVVNTPNILPTKTILLYLYLAGALYLLYRIIKQTITVVGVIRQSEILPYRSAKLIRSDAYPSSFSFFSFVFVNPSSSEMETNEIVNHEMEHVRQRHWIDLLLFELLCTLQWLNPMVWLYGRFIRQNHEFLADQHALQRTQNPAIYRAALINQLFGAEVISLANSFNYSINKKRFHMMKNTIHPPYRKLKLLIILPMIAAVFYAFAAPEYKYVEINKNSTTIQESAPFTTNVPAEVKDTAKSSVTTLEGTFVAPSPMGETSPVSGYRFSAKSIQGKSGKGTETIKGEDISLNLGNTTCAIFIDGKEATKAEFEKLDPKTIKSVSIFKGEAATSRFGNKGNNGVILIELKSNNSTSINSFESLTGYPWNSGTLGKSLIIKNGVIADDQNARNIPPETIESINVIKSEDAVAKYGDKGKNGVVEIITKNAPGLKGTSKDDVYTIVEQMPEFPDGPEGLKIYMLANVKYPPLALDNGIQGKVFISFVVNKEGRITNAKVARSVDPSLDQEALRVVESMPSWIPGKQNDKAVDVQYTLPVEFKLPKESGNKNITTIGYSSTSAPQFPGGEEALKAYIAATKKYPAYVLENGLIGRVVVGFIVNENGEIKSVKVKIGCDPYLNEEAVRIVKSMPNWIPAKNNGENIPAKWELSIGFPRTADYIAHDTKTKFVATRPNKKAEVKPNFNPADQVKELIIVPNPTSNNATITLKGSDYFGSLEVRLFDNNGKLLRKEYKSGPNFTLSVNSLTPGTYIIVTNDGSKQYQGSLVVNH